MRIIGSMLASVSDRLKTSVAMVGKTRPGRDVCTSFGRVEGVEPPPNSVNGVRRSKFKQAWIQVLECGLNEHVLTGTFTLANFPKGRKSVGAK